MNKLLLSAIILGAAASSAAAQKLEMQIDGKPAGNEYTVQLTPENWPVDAYGYSREFELEVFPVMTDNEPADINISVECLKEGTYDYSGEQLNTIISFCTFNFPENNNCFPVPTMKPISLTVDNDNHSYFHISYSCDNVDEVPVTSASYKFAWTGEDEGSFILNFESNASSVGTLESVDTAAKRYFNLQGQEIANPEAGALYIVRQGARAWKQIIR